MAKQFGGFEFQPVCQFSTILQEKNILKKIVKLVLNKLIWNKIMKFSICRGSKSIGEVPFPTVTICPMNK